MFTEVNIQHMVRYATDLDYQEEKKVVESRKKHRDASERIRDELRARMQQNIDTKLQEGAPPLSFAAVRDGESVAQLELRLERERLQKLNAWKYGQLESKESEKRQGNFSRTPKTSPVPPGSRLLGSGVPPDAFHGVQFSPEPSRRKPGPQKNRLMLGNYLRTPREQHKTAAPVQNLVLTQAGVVEEHNVIRTVPVAPVHQSLRKPYIRRVGRPTTPGRKRTRQHSTVKQQCVDTSVGEPTQECSSRAQLNEAIQKDKVFNKYQVGNTLETKQPEREEIGFAREANHTHEPHGLSFEKGEVIRVLTRNVAKIGQVVFDHGESLLTWNIGIFPSSKVVPYSAKYFEQKRHKLGALLGSFDAKIGDDVELYEVNEFGQPDWLPVRVVDRREVVLFDVISKQSGEKLCGISQLQLRHLGGMDAFDQVEVQALHQGALSLQSASPVELHNAASKLQAAFRGASVRDVRAKATIQHEAETILPPSRVVEEEDAFMSQTEVVKRSPRKSLKETELQIREEDNAAIASIQAIHRGKLARQRLAEQQAAARKLQKLLMKNSSQRRDFSDDVLVDEPSNSKTQELERHQAISKLQAIQRGRAIRNKASIGGTNGAFAELSLTREDEECAEAARKIQNAFQRRQAYREEQMNSAALRIQAIQRGRLERFKLEVVQEEEQGAAKKIQALRRGRQARRELRERQDAARKIQDTFNKRRSSKPDTADSIEKKQIQEISNSFVMEAIGSVVHHLLT